MRKIRQYEINDAAMKVLKERLAGGFKRCFFRLGLDSAVVVEASTLGAISMRRVLIKVPNVAASEFALFRSEFEPTSIPEEDYSKGWSSSLRDQSFGIESLDHIRGVSVMLSKASALFGEIDERSVKRVHRLSYSLSRSRVFSLEILAPSITDITGRYLVAASWAGDLSLLLSDPPIKKEDSGSMTYPLAVHASKLFSGHLGYGIRFGYDLGNGSFETEPIKWYMALALYSDIFYKSYPV